MLSKLGLCNRTIGAASFVAGTAIGAGMLALPMATGGSGFLKAVPLFLLGYVLMNFLGFVLYEAAQYTDDPEANLITLSEAQLGLLGKLTAWLGNTFFLFAILVAYFIPMSHFLVQWADELLGITLSNTQTLIIAEGFFVMLVYFGVTVCDYVNRLFVLLLILSFVAVIALCVPHVTGVHLMGPSGAPFALSMLPVVMLAFVFQPVVPTIKTYLENHPEKIRLALLIGTLMPLIFYLGWDFVVLGVLHITGKDSIQEIGQSGQPLVSLAQSLAHLTEHSTLTDFMTIFSFSAITTSAIAVMMCLFDHFRDGFKLHNVNQLQKVAILALIAFPIFGVITFFSDEFMRIIKYAGVIVIVLYGFLPIALVMKSRYIDKKPTPYKVGGGIVSLLVALAVLLVVVYYQI